MSLGKVQLTIGATGMQNLTKIIAVTLLLLASPAALAIQVIEDTFIVPQDQPVFLDVLGNDDFDPATVVFPSTTAIHP